MATSGSSSILIVDDDRGGREALEALLLTQGYTLVLASGGAEALRKLTETPVDLVLLDIMMPGMDGYEVCRRIRGNPAIADIPVLMLTALNDYRSRLAGFEAGADDYITKPYDSMELFARVRTITRLNRYRRQVAERIKFQQLFDLSPNGHVVIDAAGIIQLVNRNFVNMLKTTSSGDVEGSELTKWIIEDRQPEFKTILADFWGQPSRSFQFETVLLNKDSLAIPIEVFLGRVEFEGHVMLHSIIVDLRQRLEIANALNREQVLLQTLIDTLPDLVYGKDISAHFTLANQALARIFGFNSPADVIGKTDLDLKPPELAARFFSDDQRLLETGTAILDEEEPIIDPEGNWLIFSTSRVPVRNRKGELIGILGISRDITRQKNIQRELHNSDLNQKGVAAKIQALDDSLVRKEKEKNQALACLGSWFSRLGQEIDQDTRMLEVLNESQANQVFQIQGNAEALRKTAQDLLEFSQLELERIPAQSEPFALVECIRSVVDLVSGEAARKGLLINVEVDPSLPGQAVGEYESLNRVLTRLLKNAIRVTDKGIVGLRVELENYSSALPSGSFFLHAVVQDGGQNGAKVDLADLLEPFVLCQTENNPPNGFFLDLAICSRLVKRGGGSMWVEKNEESDQGLIVHFMLRYSLPQL
jgi:PAS domain S-box-containing protein